MNKTSRLKTLPAGESLFAVVGALAFVEFVSGIIQGYYTPLLSDIARNFGVNDADVNWLEGAQLMLSALVVPLFAKLGDRVGHRRMLLISAVLTAAATLALAFAPGWWWFMAAWALQGVYVVWLPLEIALVWIRAADHPDSKHTTAKAAGVLVACLQLGAIAGALAGGALIDSLPLLTVLLVPAAATVLCVIAVLIGVKPRPRAVNPAANPAANPALNPAATGFDSAGMAVIATALVLFTGALILLRVSLTNPWAWSALALSLGFVVLFVRIERRHPDPLIDVSMFRNNALWPVFLTAGLFGMSVLGAQAPLSTFARTDPAEHGFGFGAPGFKTSLLIGVYVLVMSIGALLYPRLRAYFGGKRVLAGAALTVALGYGLFVPFHHDYLQVLINMAIVGCGSGMLVAALPAAAAAAAPATQTGVATGLTNSVKTVGGAVASCVFGIALLSGATGTAGSISGYFTVWIVCSASALIAALLLMFVLPKRAF